MPEPIEVNESSWDDEVINSELRRPGRFLGRMVWPLQDDRPRSPRPRLEYDGKLNVAKVDVDNNPNIAMKYGIRSIPALIFFKDGKPVDQHVGAAPKGRLKQKIDAVLAVNPLLPRFSGGVDGARWLLRSSKPLCLVKSGVGGFDSLALPPTGNWTETPAATGVSCFPRRD